MNKPQSHRDTEFKPLNDVSEGIIGAAIEVHRALGPGLFEGLYDAALCIELDERKINCRRPRRC
jgi:GxxExxY protein